MDKEKPFPLDYISGAKRHGLRWGMVAILSLVALTAGVLMTQAPALRRYWEERRQLRQFLADQQQWAACTMPPGRVVFDTDLHPPSRAMMNDGFRYDYMGGYVPPCRVSFPYSYPARAGTVFLHRLRSPAGHERIVCVDAEGYDTNSPASEGREIWLARIVYTPKRAPDNTWYPKLNWNVDKVATSDRLRLYAGQPDAKDPSHFTIRYDYNGRQGTIDGYLRDDDLLLLVPDRGSGNRVNMYGAWTPSSPPERERRHSPAR